MSNANNTFIKGDLTVTYEPKKCIHAGACCAGLSEVFRSSVIPWIELDGAEKHRIIDQIGKCPSGALSYQMKEELEIVK